MKLLRFYSKVRKFILCTYPASGQIANNLNYTEKLEIANYRNFWLSSNMPSEAGKFCRFTKICVMATTFLRSSERFYSI